MELLSVLGVVVLSIIAYNREEQINNYLFFHKRIKRITPLIICFFISLLFSINLCLAPFNKSEPGTDSAVFLYIGKAMQNGLLPYKDLFDHKGIILYFIEYIGYFIGHGSQTGVWIIELANVFVTSILFYYIAKLFSKSRIVCYLTVFIITSLCSLTFYSGGNLVEEYALPWITLSLYIVIKFFVTKTYRKWHIVVLGCSFSIVFFIRVNMVGLWVALLLAVLIYFIKNRRIAEIFKCLFLFIVGCLIVIIPLLLYFITTDSFKEMIEYYFIFNFSYTGSASREGMIKFAFNSITYSGISSFFIVYSFCVYFKKKIIWVNTITLLFAFFSSAISGRSYPHYGIIFIPFFVIPALLTILPFMEKTRSISSPVSKKGIIAAVVAISLMSVLLHPILYIKNNMNTSQEHNELHNYLITNTTEDDDVLILGDNVNDYISANRSTNNKFFYQEPPIDISDKLCDEFIYEINKNQSNYIINSGFTEPKNSGAISNHQKVIAFLNQECKNRIYKLEKHDGFQVYVRMER